MTWKAQSMTDIRLEFVRLALCEGANRRLLCRRFGISAKTGYKWLQRYLAEGSSGLGDRSRRPHSSPGQVSADVEAAVLALRNENPAWGGRKLSAVIRRENLASPVPAASTITTILKRHGVSTGQNGAPFLPQRFEHERPNDLWQMDFKGHVGMADGNRLHPLTILDDHSRYCIALEACLDQRSLTVRQALVGAFRRYGLPLCIITDNGPPWGDGPGSPFTPLGVFLIEQGIRIAHSRPYHPQTMGKDERFHRTLKAEVLAATHFDGIAQAAKRFSQWRMTYNLRRPHQALGLGVPAQRYASSPREYRDSVDPFDYGPDDRVRRVQHGGFISIGGRKIRLPKAFHGKDIAIRPTQHENMFEAFYRHQFIARIDFNPKPGHLQPVTHVPEHVLPISPV